MDRILPAPLAPKIGYVSLGSFDPQTMEDAIQKSQFEHCLDVPGQFCGKILHATNARTRLDWGRYSLPVLARGLVSADRMTLGMLLNKGEDSLFNGNALSPGSMMLYDEGGEINVRLPPDSNWLSIQLERPSLAEIGVEFLDSGFRCWSATLGNPVRRQILRNAEVLVSASDQVLRADMRGADQAINDIEDCVLLSMANLVTTRRFFSSQPSTKSRDRTLYIVRDADNYMEANIEFPITIAEICTSLNTNIKSLERAFLRTYGVGPKQYLLKKRLSKLRQLLNCGSALEPAFSLVDAYMSCGLVHFGRAAQNYRALFGELPSQTLSQK